MKKILDLLLQNKWITGGVILVLIVLVWVLFRGKEVPPEPETVRPLKTVVLGADYSPSGRKYPCKVRAGQEVQMSFEVAGKIVVKNVNKGQQVKKGQLLMALDNRDYRNAAASARAERDRAQAQFERVKEAAAVGAVSQQELDNAQASLDQAKAELDIKQKAVEDSELVARFDGTISNILVDNYQNVQAKEPILTLQDVTSIEVVVDVPEQRMARALGGERGLYRFAAQFEYFPGKEFPLTLKELQTEADPVTQTYEATFSMPASKESPVAPGMTGYLVEYLKNPETAQIKQGLFAPLDAVPVGENGEYYVWIVSPVEGGVEFAVTRRAVKVGAVTGSSIEIVSGIKAGERIAAAGVHSLKEGQRVTLLEE
jgi:membrane fusion protein, multidrug efflux system